MYLSAKFKTILTAGAVGVFALGATSASASTLKPRNTSADTCAISQMDGSTSCEGVFLGTSGKNGYSGNDSNTDLDEIFGVSGWIEITKVDAAFGTAGILSTTATNNNRTGTWAANLSAFDMVMAVLKGGNGFVSYLMDTTAVGGNWNTSALLSNKDNQPGLSHFTLYKSGDAPVITPPPSVVPLPATGWMLIAGLGGLAAMRRRRKG